MNESTPETERTRPEFLGVASSAIRQGLRATFELHESLGVEGETEVQKNEFGDMAMRADIEAEETIIKLLESLHVHIQVHSEEHGDLEIGNRAMPIELTAVIDGLDGSSVYKRERGIGRYGTMFALLKGQNPRYNDYLAAGVMEHASGRLYLAIKNKGLEVVDLISHETKQAKVSNRTILNGNSTIYVDTAKLGPDNAQYADYIAKNNAIFADPLQKAGYHSVRLGSSAIHFVDLAIGKADFVGESTRKGSLEFATAYALVHEAGGVMLTLDGQDIGDMFFSSFGKNEHIPVLASPNREIAQQFLDLVGR